MIYLIILCLVISAIGNIFREFAYYICRKDKDKLRIAIKDLIGTHSISSDVADSLQELLKETYP